MEDLVSIVGNNAVCTSMKVAEKFGRKHKNVIKSIENLLGTDSAKKLAQWFSKGKYKDNSGKENPMYYMNRDGFTVLVMGFNGKEALDWKIKYINAFNTMEEMLKQRNTELWVEQRENGKLIRNAETDVIKQLIEYAKEQGSTHSNMLYMTYSKLANKMAGVQDRNFATFQQLNELSFIENIILNQIRIGMSRNLHYKQIYKDCKRQIELFKDIAYLDCTDM